MTSFGIHYNEPEFKTLSNLIFFFDKKSEKRDQARLFFLIRYVFKPI